jgi:NifB/MoaA-like Fe-S oxidoreductase
MKLPVNVSLHTMNPELRVKMMGNRFAGECIESLRRIVAAGNKVNIQLVLCRGINDGAELRFTLNELYNLGNIYAIAAVPVGLTKHRDGLFPLEPFDKDSSQAVIDIIEEFARKFAARDERQNGYPEDELGRIPGRRSVYASDEFFLKAGKPIPNKDYYDDFPQYENGVGFVRAFADEFLYELRENISCRKNFRGEKYILITGEGSFEPVSRLVAYAKNFYNINTTVFKVKNNFYGGGVNVTGLLTGGDIISALSGENLSGTVLLIEDMFKKDTELFLDDKTRGDVEETLKLPCEIIRRDGTQIFKKIAGI